jgi:hypothetical protein
MKRQSSFKIKNLSELYDFLPETERLIVDILRQIISENLPAYCNEKISYNVPYFYGHRGICIVWPSSVPRGGVKQGVLLGFWYGNKLKDKDRYLDHGTNKQIYYKIFNSPDEIDIQAIQKLLMEAIQLDQQFVKPI